MIEQLLNNANDKILEFANLGSEYIRLKLDYTMMQSVNQLAFHEAIQPNQMQEYVHFYMKRIEMEKQLQEMATSLNVKYNEAMQFLFDGLEIENIRLFDIEIIKKLQGILYKFNSIANIDVFKGLLYINEKNRLTMQEVMRQLKDQKDYPQFTQIEGQVQLLLNLKKS